MPSAEAEAKAAAIDNAVDVWQLNAASRLQHATPRRMRRAVAATACWSMPGVSDRTEKRFRYSVVALDAVPLSGGGIDTKVGVCHLRETAGGTCQ